MEGQVIDDHGSLEDALNRERDLRDRGRNIGIFVVVRTEHLGGNADGL